MVIALRFLFYGNYILILLFQFQTVVVCLLAFASVTYNPSKLLVKASLLVLVGFIENYKPSVGCCSVFVISRTDIVCRPSYHLSVFSNSYYSMAKPKRASRRKYPCFKVGDLTDNQRYSIKLS